MTLQPTEWKEKTPHFITRSVKPVGQYKSMLQVARVGKHVVTMIVGVKNLNVVKINNKKVFMLPSSIKSDIKKDLQQVFDDININI